MAGIALLTFVAVGVFVFGRTHRSIPIRYRSTVTVRVAQRVKTNTGKGSKSKKKATTTTTTPTIIALSGPQKFALQRRIITGTLSSLHIRRTKHIGFQARLNDTGDLLSLTVTAPTSREAQRVGRQWAKVFSAARRADARNAVLRQKNQIARRVTKLHTELQRIDAKLVKLMPIVYRGILRFDAPLGNTTFGKGKNGANAAIPPVPEQGNVYALNLAFERIQLLSALATSGAKNAQLKITNLTPEVFATLVSQTPAIRVAKGRATTIPALGGLFGGLLLALVGAVLTDRADRTIRDPEEAALTFAAPVLAMIPSDGDDFTVIAEPASPAAEAYRGLAAMSISTDRLPRALMVSTPTGDAHAQVAANFAAALSRLGLRVALIATSPDQDWYLDPFPPQAIERADRFPDLLLRAQSGALSSRLAEELPRTDLAPNLVVIPPADSPMLDLPIDGLPPLLQGLADSGVDVTVISGPPVLEEADATLVAWATRNILWALVPGEVTRAEARAAAARMELAGVTPFGVVMIEPLTIGV